MAISMENSLILVLAYLLGSIPTASWIAKIFYQVDITQVGSMNPGMTNVLRVLGWKPALPVALLDAAKGFFACWLAFAWTQSLYFTLAAGILAVLGHSFTLFASFRGGKGVLTGFGMFLFLVPISALISLSVWALTTVLTRYVSLGSILAATLLPISILLETRFGQGSGGLLVFWVAIFVCGFVIYRHRSNIRRLVQGTENKFGTKSSATGSEG